MIENNLRSLVCTKEKGFWGWFAEIYSTHPSLATRIKYLSKIGI